MSVSIDTYQDILDQAKAKVQGSDFVGAEGMLHDLLMSDDVGPYKRDALYTLAVSQRYQKKYDQALATLQELVQFASGYARGYQELGHTLLTVDHNDEARLAYENAVHLNPALLASWKALVNLYKITGRTDFANKAYEQVVMLTQLPRELLSVTSMLHEDELEKAEQICRHFLRNNKHHVEGMRLLAEIGVRLDYLDDAEFLLESCVEFAPDYNRVRYEYADVLLRRHKFEKAHAQARILIERDPDNLAVRSLLGSATLGIGDNDKAIAIFNEVLDKNPNQTRIYVTRGHAFKTIGSFDQAIASYQQAYAVEPDFGDAFWSLANTKVYEFTDDEIAHMKCQESSTSISEENRIHMCFALGKACEDRGDYESSFHYYFCGNALKQAEMRFKPARLAARVQAQKEVFTREFLSQKQDVGDFRNDPIFIVGLPRAGSTLLEQIIASHSMVDGTLELPHILALVNRLRDHSQPDSAEGAKYPRILREIDDSYLPRFGDQFINETRIFRKDAPRFVDKMPNNFMHLGLIKLILPNAKVIDARRHPMACCFSGFKQLFGEGQDFSYGLTEIGHYYREYVGLMRHWDEVIPGFVLRVQHEDVVDDLESQIRRILDFLELPFEQSCLDYYKTERSVRTPSSEQVRRPIYRSGLDVWQNFETWLDPLKSALGPEILTEYGLS